MLFLMEAPKQGPSANFNSYDQSFTDNLLSHRPAVVFKQYLKLNFRDFRLLRDLAISRTSSGRDEIFECSVFRL